MSKHTPGPWKAHFEDAYFVTGPDLGRVAMMMNLKGAHGLGGRRSGEESAANARLIAAAPDLLEALLMVLDAIGALSNKSELLNGYGLTPDQVSSIYWSIAKATWDDN